MPLPEVPIWNPRLAMQGPMSGTGYTPMVPNVPQVPQQAAQARMQGGGFRDTLRDLAPTLLALGPQMMTSRNPDYSVIGKAVSDMRQRRSTADWLRQNRPEYADAYAAGVLDRDKLFDLMFKTGSEASVYGTPIYGTDPKTGKTVLGVISKDGAFKPVDTGGVEVSRGVDKVDLGTHWGFINKQTGEVISTQPKENYQEAFDTAAGGEEGKAVGGMRVTLGQDIQKAESTVADIDSLINSPGLAEIVGPLDQYRSGIALSAEGRDALARYNQLKGKAFLQAYQMLKGGGQITEIEGTKAENAMARMDRALSEAEFKQALQDFREAVVAGAAKLREAAARQSGGESAGGGDLYDKYGLTRP